MASPSVWLITGASRGLGFEIAKAALQAGHTVVAGRRNSGQDDPRAAELQSLGGHWVNLEMAGEHVEERIAEVAANYGKIDVLVNNAGYGVGGVAEDIGYEVLSVRRSSIQLYRDIIEVNVIGVIRACQAVTPIMRSQGQGTIVNIGSLSGIIAEPGVNAYACSKHALEGFTESFSKEVSAFNIRTLLVEPGNIDTDVADVTKTGIEVARSEPYQGSPADVILKTLTNAEFLKSISACPTKTALRIVEAVDKTGMFAGRDVKLRLPLGKEFQDILDWGNELVNTTESLKDVASSVYN
ncbi:unnamed protein product [Clonostachys solani]|uniref:Uncharacterized protein n=1 Tax=Clonostachys solani TaxID=160281 RepID=A0A9N9W510_9HYPO|nr:unnamed protein product [Clonostachys solani]